MCFSPSSKRPVPLHTAAIHSWANELFGFSSRARRYISSLRFHWNRALVDNYVETLTLAKIVVAGFPSRHCGKGRFIAFLHPFQVADQYKDLHRELRQAVARTDLAINVSDAYDGFGPSIYVVRLYPASGGLMSYGIHTFAQVREAANYVDRILKGAKPGELPVQAAGKFEMVFNLKTAKALGITIPATMLGRADEVIE